MDRFWMGSNARLPFSDRPKDAFESRRSLSLARIPSILRTCRDADIFSTVVQSVTVAVIYFLAYFGLKKIAMQEQGPVFAGHFFRRSRIPCVTASIGASLERAPIQTRHVGEVAIVHLREFAARQRNETHAWLGRRLCRTPNDTLSVAVALGAALVAKFARAARTASDRIGATRDARIQFHCSPPSMSAIRAPAGDTARGYFNGGYHAINAA
jgi:hypothetical protein